MFLSLDNTKPPMKVVYQLSEDLRQNPETLLNAQSLTLDESKPFMGLKGTYGLFGSDEWWSNIENRVIPTLYLEGFVKELYVAGQDPDDAYNEFDLELDDGSIHPVGIFVNNEKDRDLYVVGAKVKVLYVIEELKYAPGGKDVADFKIVVEVAVSQ